MEERFMILGGSADSQNPGNSLSFANGGIKRRDSFISKNVSSTNNAERAKIEVKNGHIVVIPSPTLPDIPGNDIEHPSVISSGIIGRIMNPKDKADTQ